MAEGPQLIEPTGGGSAAQIAKPEHAPNYVAMYGEAIKAALAPAEFSWGTYYQSQELANKLQELGLRGSELNETKRANLIKEQHDVLDLALRGRAQDEVARHNRADETYQTGLLGLEGDREREAERHNKVDETRAQDQLQFERDREKSEAQLRDVQRADMESQKAYREQETNLKKRELDDRTNDDQELDKLNQALAKFGPVDHYKIDSNPELQKVIQDAHAHMKTAYGEQRLSMITGKQMALGQELDRQSEMTTWTAQGRDAFLDRYNSAGENQTAQQRFNSAYEYGRRMNENENARRGMDALSVETYKTLKAQGKDEETAMAGARHAEELTKASIKDTGKHALNWDQKTIDSHAKFTDDEGDLVANPAWSPAEKEAHQRDAKSRVEKWVDQGGHGPDMIDQINKETQHEIQMSGQGQAGASKDTLEKSAAGLNKTGEKGGSGALPGDVIVSHKAGTAAAKPSLPAATATPTATPAASPDTPAGYFRGNVYEEKEPWMSGQTPWSWLYQNLNPQAPGPAQRATSYFQAPALETPIPTPAGPTGFEPEVFAEPQLEEDQRSFFGGGKKKSYFGQ